MSGRSQLTTRASVGRGNYAGLGRRDYRLHHRALEQEVACQAIVGVLQIGRIRVRVQLEDWRLLLLGFKIGSLVHCGPFLGENLGIELPLFS